MQCSWVYILSSQRNGTLYIGVTNDLVRRVYEHKTTMFKGFTKEHSVKMLVYYEQFEDITQAIYREKCLKRWNRNWKLRIIEEFNPKWEDLYESICN